MKKNMQFCAAGCVPANMAADLQESCKCGLLCRPLQTSGKSYPLHENIPPQHFPSLIQERKLLGKSELTVQGHVEVWTCNEMGSKNCLSSTSTQYDNHNTKRIFHQ